MDYIVTLTRAFERTGNTAYLKRVEDLILDWISDNTRYIIARLANLVRMEFY